MKNKKRREVSASVVALAVFMPGGLSTERHIRKKVAQAIGQIGDQSCLFRLQEALVREQDASVRETIQEAIARLEA